MKKNAMQGTLVLFSFLALLCFQSCSTESDKEPEPISETVTRPQPITSEPLAEPIETQVDEAESFSEEIDNLSEARDNYIAKVEERSQQPLPETEVEEEAGTEEIMETIHASDSVSTRDLIAALCNEIGNKLGSVDTTDCLRQNLRHSGFSVEQRSLAYRDFRPVPERSPLGKVMVVGGIHGDEFSSVSVVFKWMDILQEHHSGLFHWRIIPSANPDGLVQRVSKRQNANGVDLNRNFPTQDWEQNALKYWREHTGNNTRRYPGKTANSEPETQWLIEQIESFDPDVIISMHAPYHLVDYDGPPTAPNQLGSLYLRQLGVFPGSMGNYIGVDKKMPIVTVELKSAGIMPTRDEIDGMWTDLIRWLVDQMKRNDFTESEAASSQAPS